MVQREVAIEPEAPQEGIAGDGPAPDDALVPLAPQARLLFYLVAVVRLGTLELPTIGVITALTAAFVGLWTGLVLGAVLFLGAMLLTVWAPALSYERYGWALRRGELLVQHGVVFRTVTAIPVGRVQHVDLRQGPIEQWLGLARIHVHTASGVGGDGVIPGLLVPDAESLRDRLVAASERDDGV